MKRIIFLIVIILSALSIIHSLTAIYELWQKKYVLSTNSKELIKEQQKNKNLKQQLQLVSNQSFVEEEARNKLFLVKEGESTVVIDKQLLGTKAPNQYIKPSLPNWEQWWELFFY